MAFDFEERMTLAEELGLVDAHWRLDVLTIAAEFPQPAPFKQVLQRLTREGERRRGSALEREDRSFVWSTVARTLEEWERASDRIGVWMVRDQNAPGRSRITGIRLAPDIQARLVTHAHRRN